MVLMVVDAAFDSIGLNYFNSIVPKVVDFEEDFIKNGKVNDLKDLSELPYEWVKNIWANKRSWNVANSVASYLRDFGQEGTQRQKSVERVGEMVEMRNSRGIESVDCRN